MSCYSSKSDVCCPISCAGIKLFPTQLILIKRCTPIRHACDNVEFNIFQTTLSPTSTELPKGFITVMNNSTECFMTVNVTENGNLPVPYQNIPPGGSITIEVNDLVSVDIVCNDGNDMPVAGAFCEGTFEADLQYSITK
ncbi:S-Ena type endospore appendage [Chengkuizengella axinellae]|uniref:Endospore appendages core domain-containing protein n=1 Tax=Chengkuizengella axinellae TaxID=3064388 RepID=A0ABT9IW03_9BACL|nr:S-Ena type endospore appendage [Chengkuizengella sp. 2205SS18-9]MDP5273272.1 hypothetical protein [Chengkuizengella sp. 2205SS18-9]